VAADQQRSDRAVHLDEHGAAAVVVGPVGEVQVDLVDGADRPPAGDRGAAVGAVADQPLPLVDDVVAVAEELLGRVAVPRALRRRAQSPWRAKRFTVATRTRPSLMGRR